MSRDGSPDAPPPYAKKRFGQHFLHDERIVDRILRALDPRAEDAIVEIGPGRGALTAPLLRRIPAMTVVEIDRDVVEALREACGRSPGLDVRLADALKFDFASLAPPEGRIRLVGNLPYNISTPLLFHLLKQAAAVRDMHFMLQKEVVDRMAAGPGDDAYGRLSVALAARADVVHLFDVGPGAFKPPPRVDSAVVRLVPRPPVFPVDDWATFDRVVAAAFGQRRKQLANSLKGIATAEQFAAADIDPSMRAERLSAEAFARLANRVASEDPARR